MTSQDVIKAIFELKNQDRAEIAAWFLKSQPGGYGEGDMFLGLRVPQTRLVAKKFAGLDLQETEKLLQNQYHDVRLTALHILVAQYKKGDAAVKWAIFDIYSKNLDFVNNWDLVDTSAPYIPGPYLFDKDRAWLYELVETNHLWRQRVAIISTFYFIRNNDFGETLNLAEKLLNHPHDLIHKAVGWMLREVGNRAPEVEEDFLQQHYKNMPRTMLRYAIEKFPERLRQNYLKGRI